MAKPSVFTICIGCGFIALTCLSAQSAEPTYQNKTLTQWLKLYDQWGADSAQEKKAREAVRAIGTNAIPRLLSMLTNNDELLAGQGFEILGPLGAPAVPALSNLLATTNELAQLVAAQSLGHIGAPALTALMTALTNRSYKMATAAALAIVDLKTNAATAIPIFLRDLKHPNHYFRERAADALGNLHIEPQIVVPALTNLLNDYSSHAARFIAIRSLAQFGTNAQPAVPVLVPLLSDLDEDIRSAATNALKDISPTAVK